MKKTIIILLLAVCGTLVVSFYINEKPLIKDPSESRIVLIMLGERDITNNIVDSQKLNILDILKKYHRSPSITKYKTYKVTTETIEISLVDQDEKTWHLVIGDVTFCYSDNDSQYTIQDSGKLFEELRVALLNF